ncbi:MAG TPA: isoaspartyl peptidase/L-asparaginase family protein [Patescibacteria group bacterium]|nr:isoaspartyl peptidase/L-asparaginase family protein [Patescibacteria group bacterium]
MTKPAIIVHGGCGRVEQSTLAERMEGVKKAAQKGWLTMQEGGTAVDAVEAAVIVLEDIPLFNAGRGSVLNSEGRIEMDASIMDGATLSAGAVAGVTGILNPIRLARRVMDASPHVMLIGEGAERFADAEKIERCAAECLVVQRRREEWERTHGTVGAAACDQRGLLAAATSTGGTAGKLPGRVGDTPIIGSGTFADSRVAVSCTGNGEQIMRMTLARLVSFLHEECNDTQRAVEEALQELSAKLGGEVGLIAADSRGRTALIKNSLHMPVCAIRADGTILQC